MQVVTDLHAQKENQSPALLADANHAIASQLEGLNMRSNEVVGGRKRLHEAGSLDARMESNAGALLDAGLSVHKLTAVVLNPYWE
ncbi:hypothetical protein WJX84_005787 [Apatococcus fuscideae]|uniref:Uncharacterized protein n=1 Tax=Apatococcus fuscideae TaxID=2026836 RepID=A0AAW1SYN9_9CHLO